MLLLLLCLPVAAARAEVLRDLYAARVPVSDRGESALTAGAREALSRVLVKVSGTRDVLDYPAVREAMDDARGHVRQYAFDRDPDDDMLRARFEFDSAWVTAMVVDAGAPLWTANRPPVLLWLAVENAGDREFLTRERAPEAVAGVREAFAARGLPVTFPLYDLADSSAITPDDVWRLDASTLRDASTRYGTQHIAAGRYAVLSSGAVVGDWSYFGPNARLDRAVTAESPVAFAVRGADIIAGDMAARYAVAATAVGDAGIPMAVVGVASYADYAGLVSWLQSLELVERANVERIVEDRLDLRLHASADAARLATLIELNNRLQPIAPAAAGPQLSYQWLK
jgi:hypothetical protein